MWSVISFKLIIFEKYAIFGPGQIETPLPSTLLSKSFTNNAVVPNPTQIHALSTIFSNLFWYLLVDASSSSSFFNFSRWYWREAVQMFLAENSLSETRYPLGQELPGVPFAIKDNFSRSLVLSLRLIGAVIIYKYYLTIEFSIERTVIIWY